MMEPYWVPLEVAKDPFEYFAYFVVIMRLSSRSGIQLSVL